MINQKLNKPKQERYAKRVLCLMFALFCLCTALAGCDGGDTDSTQGYYGEPVTEYKPTSAELYCLEITSYSGPFVEDGKNEQVENVAAILVENRSKQFLDYATVTYYVGGEIATFNVTGLPVGGKAWVLEKDRLQLDGTHSFEFLDCESVFKKDAVTSTADIGVEVEGNTLTLKSKTSKTLNNVCVYYKNVNSDGNYMGGITYMLNFGTLNVGQSVQKQSAHFGENSQIVRFSFQEE